MSVVAATIRGCCSPTSSPTSAAVAATRSRTAKAAAVAALLARADAAGVPVATAWLTGEPLQGRLGVGWRTLSARAGAGPAQGPGDEEAPTRPRS